MKKILLTLILMFVLLGNAHAKTIAGTISDVTLTSANAEYTAIIPAGTFAFTIQSRTSADFKLGVTSGASGTTYVTVKAGSAYYESSFAVPLVDTTIYLQSTTAGQVIEVLSWKAQQGA